MFTFITSIRHPRNSLFYERVWDLLRNTLFSVCSQTDVNFRVIVVCNEILDDFSDNQRISKHVEFVRVSFDSPSLSDGPTTGVPACNLDRGLKFVIGLVAANKYSPEYIMFFDADDFVSDGIVEYCNKTPGKMGWYFERGAYFQDYNITYRLNFRNTCGTSHVLNFNTLKQDVPMDKLSVESTPDDIRTYVHPYFIKGVLGCHMNYETYFFNCYDTLEEWPLPDTAAYNMGTGENHSGKTSSCGPGWLGMRRSSTRKLDRGAYKYHFPLINHKRKLIPIYTSDSRCKKVFAEAGIYNPVELSHAEVSGIYGRATCAEYTSVTFISNPWERCVNEYHATLEDQLLENVTFSEYIRSGVIARESNLIPEWIDHVFKIEDLGHSEETLNNLFPGISFSTPIKSYSGHYSSYYTDADRDFVTEHYSGDIQLGSYEFHTDPEFSDEELPTPVDLAPTCIPNVLHFSYGMRGVETLEFYQYMAIKSAIHYNNPEKVYFHYHHEPIGPWWNLIKPYMVLNKVPLVKYIFGNPVTHYAHQSDIVRLHMLYKYGGIYMDLDTLTLRSFAPLLKHECVLGLQDSPQIYHHKPELADKLDVYGVCNATMLARPGSEFIREWFYRYTSFKSKGRDNLWDHHSVVVPNIMCKSKDFRKLLTVKNSNAFFYPIGLDVAEKVFSEPSSAHLADFSDSYSIHLWDNDYEVNVTNDITPTNISSLDCVYSKFATPVYSDMTAATLSLVFLTNNRLELTSGCLDSWLLMAEASPDVVELLIYDNASDPDFVEYLKLFEASSDKVRVIYSASNDGVAGGRAVLFEEAVGDIVVSVDSDAYLRSREFIDRAKLALSDTAIGMCGVVGANFQNYSTFEHTDLFDGAGEGFVDSLAGCCQIFRRSLYGDKFTMDTTYKPFWLEDTDLCLQLAAAGYKILRINSNGGFDHEWGGTGNDLFPNSFKDKHKYFLNKWEL